MAHSTLTPVFVGLRFALHALLIGLAVFACVRSFLVGDPMACVATAIGCVFVGVYVLGAVLLRRRGGRGAAARGAVAPASEYLPLARETAASNLAETRRFIRELTPERLDDGLASALRRLGTEVSSRAGLQVQVRADDLDLTMDVQTALLRITQGALSNVVRHACATRMIVTLEGTAGPTGAAVVLTVTDDGVGFDPTDALTDPHGRDSFGLVAMHERVTQLGGRLHLDTAPGRGTTITAALPRTTTEEAAV
jgi:signal transduction histidine kinase